MAKTAPKNFEAALEEIDRLVADLETGKLPLGESLAAYKRGTELLNYAQKELAEVELQVKLLEGETLQPFARE